MQMLASISLDSDAAPIITELNLQNLDVYGL